MPEERVEREEVNAENRQPNPAGANPAEPNPEVENQEAQNQAGKNRAKINPEEEELEESKKKVGNKQPNPAEADPEEEPKKEEKKAAQQEALSFDEELAELIYGDKKKAANMQCYTFYFDDKKWGLSRVFNREMSMKNARKEAREGVPKEEINLQAAKEGRLFVVSDKAPYLQKVTLEGGKIKLVVVNENPIKIPQGLSGNEAKAWNNLKSNFEKLVQGNTAEAHGRFTRAWRNRQARNCVNDIVKQTEKVHKQDMLEAEKNAKIAKKLEESRQNSRIIDINEEVEREMQREEAQPEQMQQENVQENAEPEAQPEQVRENAEPEAQPEQARENAEPEVQPEQAVHEEPKAEEPAEAKQEEKVNEAEAQPEEVRQEEAAHEEPKAQPEEEQKIEKELEDLSKEVEAEAQQKEEPKEEQEIEKELEDLSREVEKEAQQKEEPKEEQKIEKELEDLSREVEKEAQQKEEPKEEQKIEKELEDLSREVEKEAQPEEKEKDTSDLISETAKLITEAQFKKAAANVAKAMQNLSGQFQQSTFLDQNAIDRGMEMSALMDMARANKGVMSELEKIPEFKGNMHVYQGQQNLAEMGDLGQKARMRLEAEHQQGRNGQQSPAERLQNDKNALLEVMAGEFACNLMIQKEFNSRMMKMIETRPDAKMFIQGFKELMENNKTLKSMLMENPKHLQEELSNNLKRQEKYQDMLKDIKVDKKRFKERKLQKENQNERKNENEKDSMVLSNKDKRMDRKNVAGM